MASGLLLAAARGAHAGACGGLGGAHEVEGGGGAAASLGALDGSAGCGMDGSETRATDKVGSRVEDGEGLMGKQGLREEGGTD